MPHSLLHLLHNNNIRNTQNHHFTNTTILPILHILYPLLLRLRLHLALLLPLLLLLLFLLILMAPVCQILWTIVITIFTMFTNTYSLFSRLILTLNVVQLFITLLLLLLPAPPSSLLLAPRAIDSSSLPLVQSGQPPPWVMSLASLFKQRTPSLVHRPTVHSFSKKKFRPCNPSHLHTHSSNSVVFTKGFDSFVTSRGGVKCTLRQPPLALIISCHRHPFIH